MLEFKLQLVSDTAVLHPNWGNASNSLRLTHRREGFIFFTLF
jgi:hypothetical protein